MDPQQANLQSIDVLERTRAAFIRCREEVGLALSEADTEVDRMVTWLQNDRVNYWRNRINRLREDLNNARSALFRKETVVSSKDSKPSTVDERKTLAKVKAMLEDAEKRAARTRTWAQAFPREQALYKGGTSAVSAMHDRDLPAAIVALGKMAVSIERYVRGEPPDLTKLLEDEIAQSEKTTSMRRGAGEAPASVDEGANETTKEEERPS
ncbi:MAG: hypothetical protein K8R92_09485 [Planctomycetes bacterium]|nr:hypothetical protein [Planctomycetota bacterium]